MTSSLFIGPNLVIDYFTLPNVTPIQAPPELWWSSRERKAVDDVDGLGTSEYLELDFGRLRSLNFLSFDIIQKPITITLEYDVWAFDTGIKMWQAVTPLQNERFDDFVSYSPDSTNPWQNSQFYFTNVKGDLISARYVRLRFERRDEPWPNGDVQNTFPWSIDVKNLRTARYVTNINDARGVLVAQGKVANPIVDPVHYDDGILITEDDIPTLVSVISAVEFEGGGIDAATVTLVGVPSGADVGPSTDAATVTLVGVPSSSDIAPHVDAATVTLTGVPSGSDIAAHVDADTVPLVGVPSGVDEYTSGTPPDDFGADDEFYIGMFALPESTLFPDADPISGGGPDVNWTRQIIAAAFGGGLDLSVVMFTDDTDGHLHADLPSLEQGFVLGPPPVGHCIMTTVCYDPADPGVTPKTEGAILNTQSSQNNIHLDLSGGFGDGNGDGISLLVMFVTRSGGTITGITGGTDWVEVLSDITDANGFIHRVYVGNKSGDDITVNFSGVLDIVSASATAVLPKPGGSFAYVYGNLATGATDTIGTGQHFTAPNHYENF